ncbi:MAG: hypothetical protein AB7K64_09525 [Variibacter sp.]
MSVTTELSLDDRIADAFARPAPSSVISELVAEATEAARDAEADADAARVRALDPALTASQVADARRAMEDAAFRRERMRAAVERLRDLLRDARDREKDEKRREVYERVRTERDQLAAELSALYPRLAEQLAGLMARIVENDRMVEYVNGHELPGGAPRLLLAELVARDMKGFVHPGGDVPRMTRHLRLPTFRHSVHDPYSWPRQQ